MKNSGLKKILITALFLVFLSVLIIFIGSTIYKQKSFAYDNGMDNIASFVDENIDLNTISFILEDIDIVSKQNIENNSFKITCDDNNISLSFLGVLDNNEITSTDNTVTMPSNCIKVKVDGISKGNTYNIKIEPKIVKFISLIGNQKIFIKLI